jgi:hypothetical protein
VAPLATGLTTGQTMRRLPQAFPVVLPAILGRLVAVLEDTSPGTVILGGRRGRRGASPDGCLSSSDRTEQVFLPNRPTGHSRGAAQATRRATSGDTDSTMETMHAAGRRTLPPVPRAGSDRGTTQPTASPTDDVASLVDVPTQRFVVDFSTGEQRRVPPADAASPPRRVARRRETSKKTSEAGPAPEQDAAQVFVEGLRSAASDFAEAAGAESAVVREAVPPARHRRARCRVVLRYADDTELDVTFLGPTGSPGTPSRHGFDRQIRRWLGAGQQREATWLVPDEDASEGLAIDVSAWAAAS